MGSDASLITGHRRRISAAYQDNLIPSATLFFTGDGLSQEAKEKILVAVGNIAGISSVDDQVKTTTPAAESQFYTVKSGDTLSAISKQVYGNANLYNKIFEANKPMLKSPEKIYPGQVLRIPEE